MYSNPTPKKNRVEPGRPDSWEGRRHRDSKRASQIAGRFRSTRVDFLLFAPLSSKISPKSQSKLALENATRNSHKYAEDPPDDPLPRKKQVASGRPWSTFSFLLLPFLPTSVQPRSQNSHSKTQRGNRRNLPTQREIRTQWQTPFCWSPLWCPKSTFSDSFPPLARILATLQLLANVCSCCCPLARNFQNFRRLSPAFPDFSDFPRAHQTSGQTLRGGGDTPLGVFKRSKRDATPPQQA